MAFSIAFSIKSDLKDTAALLSGRGLEDGGRAQQALDGAAVSFCEPYVPLKTGALMNSARASLPGSGEICYSVPYARAQYYEGRENGMRGPMWFERMKADRLGDLLALTAAACGGEAEKR